MLLCLSALEHTHRHAGRFLQSPFFPFTTSDAEGIFRAKEEEESEQRERRERREGERKDASDGW